MTVLIFGPRNHSNHLHKAHDRTKNDSAQKEPMRVQPIVEQFAQQQSNHYCGGNDEGDL